MKIKNMKPPPSYFCRECEAISQLSFWTIHKLVRNSKPIGFHKTGIFFTTFQVSVYWQMRCKPTWILWEGGKTIRSTTFKTAPWVNLQHEEFKTSTHWEAILALCCVSLQNKRRIFCSIQEGCGLDKLKLLLGISWRCYILRKILDDQWKYLGVLGATTSPRMQSVTTGRGWIPNELSNLPFLGDAQTHFVMVIAVGCPTWTEESWWKGHPVRYDVMVQALISLVIDSNCSGISICYHKTCQTSKKNAMHIIKMLMLSV